jgi:hypothetical protein
MHQIVFKSGTGEVAQVVESPPSKCEAFSLNPSTAKKKVF